MSPPFSEMKMLAICSLELLVDFQWTTQVLYLRKQNSSNNVLMSITVRSGPTNIVLVLDEVDINERLIL
jgi:hypothetical protein